MYDKYFIVNPVATDGTAIPKCKGMLVNVSGASAGVTFHFRGANSGNTLQTYLTFTTGANVLSIQPYSIPSNLPAGVTAFYLN
jgi:hypothetical protein